MKAAVSRKSEVEEMIVVNGVNAASFLEEANHLVASYLSQLEQKDLSMDSCISMVIFVSDIANQEQMTSGANPNKIFVVVANGASTTNLYDLASDTWAASSPVLTAAASPGSNGFLVPSGGNSGKLLVLHGALTSSSFYDPSGNTMGGGPALTGNMGGGSCVFSITAGPQMGKVMVVLGGNQTVTNIFDPSASTFSAGPSLTANANGGAQCFSIQ